MLVITGLLIGVVSTSSRAAQLDAGPKKNGSPELSPWSLVFFAGALTEKNIGFEILPPEKFRNDFMAGIGLNYRFWTWRECLAAEVEGVFAQHWGNQAFGEVGGVVMLRWLAFPWNHWVRTSLAVGEGASYDFQVLDFERREPGVGPINNLLNLMIFEISLSPACTPHWALVGRLHHRSPAFNLYGHNHESNFFSLGLRYNF